MDALPPVGFYADILDRGRDPHRFGREGGIPHTAAALCPSMFCGALRVVSVDVFQYDGVLGCATHVMAAASLLGWGVGGREREILSFLLRGGDRFGHFEV